MDRLSRLASFHYEKSGSGPRSPTGILVWIRPTIIHELPVSCFRGPWSDSKIELMRMVCTDPPIRHGPFSAAAVHLGMSDAIEEGHVSAPLILAEYGGRSETLGRIFPRDSPLELPADLFHTLALCALKNSQKSSTSISLFKLLLRTQADSMPKSDAKIEHWAASLRSQPSARAFGQWVLDFSAHPSEDETARNGPYVKLNRVHEEMVRVRRSMFFCGEPNHRRDTQGKMTRRLVEIEGGNVEPFTKEVRDLVPPYV